MRKISTKLILLLIAASLVPLLTYGTLSLMTSRKTASNLASERNMKVAQRAAEEISLYLDNNMRILKSIAATISRTPLQPRQIKAILRNTILEFKEYQIIHLIDPNGKVIVSSSIKSNFIAPTDESFREALEKKIPYRSQVFITDELIPTISLGFPMTKMDKLDGMILGVVNLLDVWRIVSQIKIGKHGNALILSNTRRLLAHGDPSFLPIIIERKVVDFHPLAGDVLKGQSVSGVYKTNDGLEMLSVGVPLPRMSWALIIDQPLQEAFVEARSMTRRLGAFTVVFTLITCLVGFIGGRRYVIQPINKLIEITRAFARGALEERVEISTKDEFGELGQSFNSMASDLEKLEEKVKRKEREATLGLIAGGLVHDLKHPIKNIENMTNLLDEMFEKQKYRERFKTTVLRELATINRYFDDLADIATTKPIQCIPVNLIEYLNQCFDQFQTAAASQGIGLIREIPDEALIVSADTHALNRVFNNIVNNALDAMAEGGTLKVSVRRLSEGWEGKPDQMAEVAIKDTGPGITPEIKEKVFEGFVSSKSKGLGLGLSIAKKLTEAHGGHLNIQSFQGEGTTCIITLPLLIS